METLEIEGFLVIRVAHVEVRGLTVLIGPQASGKSIIAKLLYFFRDVLSTGLYRSIRSSTTLRELKRGCVSDFELMFPRYAWTNQAFRITYTNAGESVSLEKASNRAEPRLDFSPGFDSVRKRARSAFERNIRAADHESDDRVFVREHMLVNRVWHDSVNSSRLSSAFLPAVYVPASRSFFANLQKNVFAFLADNIDIDPLIKSFGAQYERCKWAYDRGRVDRTRPSRGQAHAETMRQMEAVLRGQYIHSVQEDWIESDRHRVNVANASSGQQEALPMLVVLAERMQVGRDLADYRTTYFIEEPEAHLFPTSQKTLVEMFARLMSNCGHSFVLTSHSPYVLTAINNLVTASRVGSTPNGESAATVERLVPRDQWIDYASVSAYTVADGGVISIKDDETMLVGAGIIDSVSDTFDETYDALIGLE